MLTKPRSTDVYLMSQVQPRVFPPGCNFPNRIQIQDSMIQGDAMRPPAFTGVALGAIRFSLLTEMLARGESKPTDNVQPRIMKNNQSNY